MKVLQVLSYVIIYLTINSDQARSDTLTKDVSGYVAYCPCMGTIHAANTTYTVNLTRPISL